MQDISFKFSLKHLPEILIIAIIYFSTAKVGQILAILPGNITPVWLPSGIMLAAILVRGFHIWPGIFLGAFFGNVWAYIDINSLSSIVKCLFTGTANGIGDVLSAAGAGYFILRATGTNKPFDNVADVTQFLIWGVAAGPAMSAIFGVTTLCVADFISWKEYINTFLTWWTGDGVGVLIIAPFLLVFKTSWKKLHGMRVMELAAFFITLVVTTAYCLNLFYWPNFPQLPLFTLTPLLLWSAFRFERVVTYLSVLLVSCMVIILTVTGQGPFSGKEINRSLIELQWFLAVMSITLYILCAVIKEQSSSEQLLQESHDLLEKRVMERTASLKQALEEVKTLRGIIPLCSFCKKIRDDKGYWEQVDVYIHKYSEANISHSICPKCMKTQYPNVYSSIYSDKDEK
jgi:integral membrane sensor domain MASE1